jgi:hypothetical protein
MWLFHLSITLDVDFFKNKAAVCLAATVLYGACMELFHPVNSSLGVDFSRSNPSRKVQVHLVPYGLTYKLTVIFS